MRLEKAKYQLLFILLIFLLGFSPAQSLKIGSKIPDFSSIGLDGKIFTQDSIKGNITLIEFWAPWCSPCLENNEELISTYNLFKPKGFDIITIALEKDRDKILKVIQKYNYPWSVNLWEIEAGNASLAITYEVENIPRSILINEKHEIIALNPDSYEVEKRLKKFFK